ncbi:MAG: hypothetical protein QOI74_3863 [Micromonosporaceae bacterium]|nr:hypothetical protein [Micromonosporaceae bacterium]
MPFWRRMPRIPRLTLPASALSRIRRPTLVINAILVVLLLTGAFLSYRTVAVADTTTTTSGPNRVVTVSQGRVTSSVSASGTVQSAATANANFVTAGTVTEIDVTVGDSVRAGQVLAKVNAAAAQDQLNAAQANLTSAQQSLARAQSATPVDAATVASAQAQVTSAQNSVNAAQRALDGTTLVAPAAGTVVAVTGTVGGSSGGSAASGSGSSGGGGTGGTGNGSTANGAGNGGAGTGAAASGSSGSGSTTGFVQLADLTRMQVSANFAEADATKLKVDQVANVTWAALSGARVTGKVATIAPSATVVNNINSYPVTVSLDSMPAGIRIGQTVSVLVTAAESAQDAIRVPAAAVRGTGQVHTVNVVGADNKQQLRRVEVGVQGDQFVEITSGLAVGDRVALNLPTATGGAGRVGGGFGGGLGGGGGFGGAGGAGAGAGAGAGGNRGGTRGGG